MSCFLGVDVGTGSARAGIFDDQGRLLGTGEADIALIRPHPDWAQQSSADIWRAVCASVAAAVASSGNAPVAGIGFDATCSLVVGGVGGSSVSIDPNGAPEQDIIVWMDHRATRDAAEINAIGGAPLAHVGGRISPEMQMPKLRWLKREMPGAWEAAADFWDLSDWLTFRATGSKQRSLCTVGCKWTYLGQRGVAGEGWDTAFLASIGLAELAEDGRHRIGQEFLAPGMRSGVLSASAAAEFGLPPGIPVAAGLIDAHAGALGTLGVGGSGAEGRMALIAGTSTCHIALTPEPSFVPGIWGPYWGAVTPGMWCNEGGQSAAGALLDVIVSRHSASADLANAPGGLYAALERQLDAMTAPDGEVSRLTDQRHIQPDWHGNRSPLADPSRRGGIDGFTLGLGPKDLALDYLAAIQALAYGTRHIVEAMRDAGVAVHTLVPSGGLARSGLFLREMADATGCTIARPVMDEPVLLGAAMLGAVAAGRYADAAAAMSAMASDAETISPRGDLAEFHDRKYRVFRRMQDDHAAYARIMAGGNA